MRYRTLPILLILTLVLLFVACAGPRSMPAGPTPIPTLIPATEPANLPEAAATQSFIILSYPAETPSSARGKSLYEAHCASCHGEEGKGVVPGARNFDDLDYMRGEFPAFFYQVISEGRGEMPSFQNRLSSDERWDVVFYTWRFSTNAETLALGKAIYDANCAACHGFDGIGTVLGAADFTDLRFMDDRAPRDFYLTVTQGKGSMPAWQGRLSQEERWASIDYLRTFSYEAALPSDVAVSVPTPSAPKEVVCSPDYISQTNPFAWDDPAAIAAGKSIYNQSCGMCHKTDGSGAMPGAPDFTTVEVQDELRSNSGQALCVVAEGSKTMPGWKETLSTEEIWQSLTYMGSFTTR